MQAKVTVTLLETHLIQDDTAFLIPILELKALSPHVMPCGKAGLHLAVPDSVVLELCQRFLEDLNYGSSKLAHHRE